MSRRKAPLSRERIAAVALAIADKEGFEAVSMRRVGEELEAGTMSLYYYVKTKSDLIGAMDDLLMRKVLLPAVPKDWKRAITRIATRTHAMLLRHPWALLSMQATSPGVNAMRHMEQCLQALEGTSMTLQQKLTLLALVDDFVFGHALREGDTVQVVDMDFLEAQMATGNFPLLTEAFKNGKMKLEKDRFQDGLRLLLAEYGPQRPRALNR